MAVPPSDPRSPSAGGAPSDQGTAAGRGRVVQHPDVAGPVAVVVGDGDEAELASRLRMATTRLARRLRQQGGTTLTPTQASALASVDRLGAPTLGELAARERVQPPSITRSVASLEVAGLVTRLVDRTDRRVTRVQLTDRGRATLAHSRSLRTAYLAGLLERLDVEQRRGLRDAVELLERLVDEE